MTEVSHSRQVLNAWLLEVDDDAGVLAAYLDLLDDAERARARRFHRPADRAAFVVARGALRLLMSRRLDCAPRALTLVAGSHGKPALAGGPADLDFNVSHSGGMVLLALGTAGPVGVDIEAVRDLPDCLAIARRYFAPAEAEVLAALPAAGRGAAFLRGWTRKEACLKARGSGLSGGLGAFPVDLADNAPPEWIADPDPAYPAGWTVAALPVPPGYCAALAWQGRAHRDIQPRQVTPAEMLA